MTYTIIFTNNLIQNSNTNDKKTHIQGSPANDDKLKPFPYTLDTYVYSILNSLSCFFVAQYPNGPVSDPNQDFFYPEVSRFNKICQYINKSVENEKNRRLKEKFAVFN